MWACFKGYRYISGSRKTYLSDAVKDYLKLDAITKQTVAIKKKFIG